MFGVNESVGGNLVQATSILVTGGAGFIGSECVRQLANEKIYERIYVVDSLTYAGDLGRIETHLSASEVEFIHTDINLTYKYENILKDISWVVHFAAESHVDRSNQNGLPFLESNVLGTYKLLDLTRVHPNIRTLLVSTDEVYGSIERGLSNESSPLRPSSAYSASKTASDLFGLAMHHTFNQDVVITRGCNTYGPFQHVEKFIPLAISELLAGRKVPLYGDGSNIREWIHVRDHVGAIRKVLHEGKTGQIYNIGSGTRMTNLQLLDRIISQIGLGMDFVEHVQDRPGHDKRYALNSDKILNELHWSAQTNFEEGLLETITWYRDKLES